MKTFELKQELRSKCVITVKNLEFKVFTENSFYINTENKDAMFSVLSQCKIPCELKTVDNTTLVKLDKDYCYDKLNNGIIILKQVPIIVAKEIQ